MVEVFYADHFLIDLFCVLILISSLTNKLRLSRIEKILVKKKKDGEL